MKNRMSDEYEKIDFPFSYNLEATVLELLKCQSAGRFVSTVFNGVTLYSDTVTMDSAYLAVTGMTKTEHDKVVRDRQARYEQQAAEHKAKIPELTEMWIAKGNEILPEDKRAYWAKIVPIRLDDLYQGMELGNCLEIVETLNTSGDFDKALEQLEAQGHSGMSWSLVCSMVRTFSDKGDEFLNHIN